MSQPIPFKCKCKSCGNEWVGNEYSKQCPKCHSESIEKYPMKV